MSAKFDVKMTQKVLFDFLMSHMYGSFSGWFTVIFGAGAFLLAAFTFGKVQTAFTVIYLFFGVYCLPLQPVLLYFRAAKQIKLNPAFRETLTYTIDEEGIETSQNDQQMKLAWDQIVKVVETKYSFLLYTGKRYSFILPKESMGTYEAVVEGLIKKYVKPEKVKIR
ncbi:MAG: YcxB family protein [Eubacteriales bacterium]|nr:YcxB family protein [Eubacteriales bacterium]